MNPAKAQKHLYDSYRDGHSSELALDKALFEREKACCLDGLALERITFVIRV